MEVAGFGILQRIREIKKKVLREYNQYVCIHAIVFVRVAYIWELRAVVCQITTVKALIINALALALLTVTKITILNIINL